MASVADIKAAYYDICGIVRLTSPDHKAKVILYSLYISLHLWLELVVQLECAHDHNQNVVYLCQRFSSASLCIYIYFLLFFCSFFLLDFDAYFVSTAA